MRPLMIDNFAGGGGASTGIERALGRPVDVAINSGLPSEQLARAVQVAAFLVKCYRAAEHGQALDRPIDTVTSLARFAVVTVTIDAITYVIVDICMRMLSRRELANAQGFPADYVLDPIGPKGKQLSISSSIRMMGNSVCKDVAEALASANVPARMVHAGCGMMGAHKFCLGYPSRTAAEFSVDPSFIGGGDAAPHIVAPLTMFGRYDRSYIGEVLANVLAFRHPIGCCSRDEERQFATKGICCNTLPNGLCLIGETGQKRACHGRQGYRNRSHPSDSLDPRDPAGWQCDCGGNCANGTEDNRTALPKSPALEVSPRDAVVKRDLSRRVCDRRPLTLHRRPIAHRVLPNSTGSGRLIAHTAMDTVSVTGGKRSGSERCLRPTRARL